jgi:hypothetical protein
MWGDLISTLIGSVLKPVEGSCIICPEGDNRWTQKQKAFRLLPMDAMWLMDKYVIAVCA